MNTQTPPRSHSPHFHPLDEINVEICICTCPYMKYERSVISIREFVIIGVGTLAQNLPRSQKWKNYYILHRTNEDKKKENGATMSPPSQKPLTLFPISILRYSQVLMRLEDFPPSKCLYILTLSCQLHSQITLTNQTCFHNGEAVSADRICIVAFSSCGALRC